MAKESKLATWVIVRIKRAPDLGTPAAAGTPTATGTAATAKAMTRAEVETMIANIAGNITGASRSSI